jgi:WD40 repeat protein
MIRAVAISADNRWLVTGIADNTAWLWDLRATDPAANPVVLRGHGGTVDAMAISPDNREISKSDAFRGSGSDGKGFG